MKAEKVLFYWNRTPTSGFWGRFADLKVTTLAPKSSKTGKIPFGPKDVQIVEWAQAKEGSSGRGAHSGSEGHEFFFFFSKMKLQR